MSRSLALGLIVGAFLLTGHPASATIIVNGSGALSQVAGAAEGFAGPPDFDPTPFQESDSYTHSFQGSLVGSSGGVAEGDLNYYPALRSAAYASQAPASSFAYDGGNLASGSVDLNASTAVLIEGYIFNNPGAGEYAVSSASASTTLVLDLTIQDVAYTLDLSGSVFDLTLGLDQLTNNYVAVWDVTSGMTLEFFASDVSEMGGLTTPFSDSLLLLPGHTYRLGVLVSTETVCAETPSAARCPAFDPDDPASTPPLGAGQHNQVGFVDLDFTLTAVPEPHSLLLLGGGVAWLARRSRGRSGVPA
jgi:hypothetical protein